MTEIKSIFEALNKIRQEKEVDDELNIDEAYKYVIRDGQKKKIKIKRGLKKRLTPAQKQALARARKRAFTSQAKRKRAKSIKKGNKKGLYNNIEFEVNELEKIAEMLVGLNAPDDVMLAFETEAFGPVIEFLRDKGVEFDFESEETSYEEPSEDSVEYVSDFIRKGQLYKLIDTRIAVTDDGHVYVDSNDWTRDMVIYDGTMDDVTFVLLEIVEPDIGKFEMTVKGEGSRVVYLPIKDAEKVLIEDGD